MSIPPPISNTSQTLTPKPFYKKRGLIFILIIIFLLASFIYWRVWQGGLGLGPAQTNFSKIESQDNFFSSSSVSANGHAKFTCQRIWLIPEGDDTLLLQKITKELESELKNNHHIQVVRVATAWENSTNPQNPGLAPDLTLRLRLNNVEEHDTLYTRNLKVTVQCGLTTGMIQSNYYYRDNFTSPLIHLQLQNTLHHESRSIGDGIGRDRYQLTSKHIARKIMGSLQNEFTNWQEKYGELPTLPPELYPPYHSVTNLAPLQPLKPQLLGTAHGLFQHNQTLYRWADPRPTKVVLDDLAKSFTDIGWKETGCPNNADERVSLNLENHGKRIHVFPEDSPALDTSSASHNYFLQYSETLNFAELPTIWANLIQHNQWRQTAPILEGCMSPEMKTQYAKLLESQTGKTGLEWLVLAESYAKQGQKSRALETLTLAVALCQLEQISESPQMDRLRELAKQLGNEKLADRVPDETTLQKTGIPDLASSPTGLEINTLLDESTGAWWLDKNGHLYLLRVNVSESDNASDAYTLGVKVRDFANSGSTWHKISGEQVKGKWAAQGGAGMNSFSPDIQAEELGRNQFKLTIRVRK